MVVQTQVIRFAKDATDVDGATQDVVLNFTPKAIILFSDGNTADNTVSAHYHVIMGLSDGTTGACVGSTSDDADAVADTATVYITSPVFGNCIFQHLDEVNNGAGTSRATVVFGTNKVTFTWTLNDANATLITLFAIGGDDITNVKVNTVDVNTTSTGTVDYTGLGWNPAGNGSSVLFILNRGHETAIDSIIGGSNFGFGCAVSSSQRWAISNVSENAVDPTDSWRMHSNQSCITALTTTTGAIDAEADFSAWITDGFRLNWTNAPTSSTVKMTYLVIEGGTWDCGNLQSPTTATNNVDYAVSVNSNPIRGSLTGTVGTATANSVQTECIISIGATDGTNQATIGTIDEDAQGTTDSYRVNNTTNIIRPLTTNGANLEVATFDSFTTNNFRLDWGTATASQEYYGWVVVADTTPVVVTDIPSFKSFGSLGITNTTNNTIFG